LGWKEKDIFYTSKAIKNRWGRYLANMKDKYKEFVLYFRELDKIGPIPSREENLRIEIAKWVKKRLLPEGG
jgi:hypothetical protein